MAVAQREESAPLAVASPEKTKLELDLGMAGDELEKKALAHVNDPEVIKLAEQHAQRILSASTGTPEAKEELKAAVEGLGLRTQREATHKSELLKEPIRALASAGEDGGEVAKSLVDLKFQVEDLDPAKVDFDAGWMTRMIGFFLPKILANPLRRYFVRYESADAVIHSIMLSLRKGREQLERDNVTLAEDQKEMRAITKRLEQVIAVGRLIEKRIAAQISGLDPNSEQRQYLEEEVLFVLRQRIIDLQQQLTVNLQGILAIEVIIRNNRELIRGVIRAENVTITALRVAVTVAMALAHQKVVLKKLAAVTQATDNLILGTAQRLRQQGVDIHKQAAGAMLNMDTLKKAFAETNAAIEEIASFRRDALPKMAGLIVELEQLSGEAEQAVQKMERGGKVREIIDLPQTA